jgi:hypothetical protein
MRFAALALSFGLWVVAAQEASSPKPATPVEPISAILDAFRSHAVVATCDAHGNQQIHDFLLSLVRDGRLAGTVIDIIIEAANARSQELVDRFVRGEDVPVDALRPVWQESTQVQLAVDPPLYTEILPAIPTINASLGSDRKLRVLLGDPPIDWAEVKTPSDHGRSRYDSWCCRLCLRWAPLCNSRWTT